MIYWKIIKSTHVILSTNNGTRSINEGLRFEDHEKVIPYLQNRFGTKNLYFENSSKPLSSSEYTLLRNNDKQ
jgi:hypothetical protein